MKDTVQETGRVVGIGFSYGRVYFMVPVSSDDHDSDDNVRNVQEDIDQNKADNDGDSVGTDDFDLFYFRCLRPIIVDVTTSNTVADVIIVNYCHFDLIVIRTVTILSTFLWTSVMVS
jgi:hypothetical protein